MRAVLLLSMLSMLGGCVVVDEPRSGRVYYPAGRYDHDAHGHGGYFCPPGQAKKGRC